MIIESRIQRKQCFQQQPVSDLPTKTTNPFIYFHILFSHNKNNKTWNVYQWTAINITKMKSNNEMKMITVTSTSEKQNWSRNETSKISEPPVAQKCWSVFSQNTKAKWSQIMKRKWWQWPAQKQGTTTITKTEGKTRSQNTCGTFQISSYQATNCKQ